MNKICKNYISEVKSLLPLYGKNERKYINSLKTTVTDYCEEENIQSINELYDNFGSPNEVVYKYFENTNTDIIIKKIKKTKYFKILIGAIVLSLFISTVAYCLLIFSEYQMMKRQEMVYAETVIS